MVDVVGEKLQSRYEHRLEQRGSATTAGERVVVEMSRKELPPTPSSRTKWKTAYRVVQSFNRFKRGLATSPPVDVSSPEQQDETRASSKRSKSKEPTPEPIKAVDPVYLALKQATGKYGPAKRRPSVVDSDHTPSPNNLSQVSLQDSGYAGDGGSTTASGRGLERERQLGSTPLLKTQQSVEEQYLPDEPPPNSTSLSKRPPRLDKAMKSLSLDCPETSNPLSFSAGRKNGRPSLIGVGVVKKAAVVGPRSLQQQLAPPSRALRKNSSIDTSADELDPRSSTSCSPCPSPLQAGSTNSLPAGSVYTLFIVTHEYRPQRLPEEFELLLGDRMIVVDNGDPDWYHGFKQGDRTETLISFPATCVAGLWPNESVMKLVQNVSLSDGRKTLRLYRDQVVFAQPDTIHDGCVMVRTERNAKAMCPIHQLMLIDS